MRCPSFEENLVAAIHSFNHAIRLLDGDQQHARAAALCLELADTLVLLEKPGQALAFYQRAAEIRAATILDYILAREKVAECHIKLGDLYSAATVLTEVAALVDQQGGNWRG